MAAAINTSGEPHHHEEDLTLQTITVDRSTGRTVAAVRGETLEADDTAGWVLPRRRAAARQQGPASQASPTGESAAKASSNSTTARTHFARRVNAMLAKSARMPASIPRNEHKIIVRPRGGLHAGRVRATELMTAIMAATGITRDEALRDTICPNVQQNIIVVSTPCEVRAAKYAQLQALRVSDQEYEVYAYQAAPDGTAKGVIHGIAREDTLEEIRANVVNEYNPLALDAHRIGNSSAVIVLFQGLKVPSTVKYGAVLLRCSLYRQHREVCTTCGKLGHRRDVCPQPHVRVCLACGTRDPSEGHELACKPHCKLCGGPHSTGAPGCTNKFKTPYVVKRRQWERREKAPENDDRSFPPLNPARGRGRSRSRGRSRGGRSRSRARSDACCSADRSARGRSRSRNAPRSRERVAWTAVVKETPARRARSKTPRRDGEHSDVTPRTSRQSPPEKRMNAVIVSLRNENAQLRQQLADINEKLQRFLAAQQQQPQAPAHPKGEQGRVPLPPSLTPRHRPQPTPPTPASPQPTETTVSLPPSSETAMEAQEDEESPRTRDDEQEARTQGGISVAVRLRRCTERIDRLEKRVDALEHRMNARFAAVERRLDALQEFLYRKLGRDDDVAVEDRSPTVNTRTSP